MNYPAHRFSHKAEKYALYRWDYSPQAIDAIFTLSSLSGDSSVADIGSGTGMLSRHFIDKVKTLYAVEPNSEMREYAERLCAKSASFISLDGCAEAIPLPDHSIDMIVVGRAIHWFDPPRAKAEFVRVLKSDGWLAILQVPYLNSDLVDAVKSIQTAENGWDVDNDKGRLKTVPFSFYYGDQKYYDDQFPSVITETWNEFFGRLCSLSPAPNENHDLYLNLENAAQEIFQKFSRDGRLTVEIATRVQLGRISYEGK